MSRRTSIGDDNVKHNGKKIMNKNNKNTRPAAVHHSGSLRVQTSTTAAAAAAAAAAVGATTTTTTTTSATASAVRREDRDLIVGGMDADPKRFPYYVRLDYEGEFGCGGSLISRNVVLTAAHCAFESDVGILHVTIGAYRQPAHTTTTRNNGDNDNDGDNDDDYSGGHTRFTRPVTRILRHPTYHDSSDINDIALLFFDPPVPPGTPTIALNRDRSVPKVGDSVTSIGLGLLDDDEQPADILQQVELKVQPDTVCDQRFEGYVHRKSMLCASDANQDSCSGDSGGPLIIMTTTNSNSSGTDGVVDAIVGHHYRNDIQVGVVSFGGEECAHETIPGVYADVAYVYPWIERALCEYSVDPRPSGCQNASKNILIGPNQECRDYPGALYMDWWFQFQRCPWLSETGRIDTYCHRNHEAWVQCPFTCHSCTYLADDDELVGFTDDGDAAANITFDTDYETSSSQAVLISLFVVSFVLFCCMCVWSLRQCFGWCGHKRRRPAY